MTPLGIYLAISLVFLMTALLEFALVLFLKRKIEMANDISKRSVLDFSGKNLNQVDGKLINDGNFGATAVSAEDKVGTRINATPSRVPLNKMKTGICIDVSLTTRIDIIMFWLSTLGYIIFNAIYWTIYQEL